MGLSRTEATLEVYADSFVEETGSVHQALLWVLQQQEFGEFCVRTCMVICRRHLLFLEYFSSCMVFRYFTGSCVTMCGGELLHWVFKSRVGYIQNEYVVLMYYLTSCNTVHY